MRATTLRKQSTSGVPLRKPVRGLATGTTGLASGTSAGPSTGRSAARVHRHSAPRQISLDDLGTPLDEVMFCVIDLETTGASPTECGITEVAAVKYLGGTRVGTFTTLVNPGVPIPPEITYLTGITHDMVGPAPTIDAVLPALIEFVRDSVIVGHNVRFDIGFLNAALVQRGYPKLANRSVDTLRLARRLLRDEVPNCRLGTLVESLGLPNRPTHRALADVHATADVLHHIFERAAGLGVMGLDDLLELPTLGRHPSAAKLRLTDGLPRRPGVYLFRDATGTVLYVGKATNLRQRVRSYFGFDERRKVGPLLQVTAKIDHFECATVIEAEVMEVRLIQHFLPRFNRQSKFWTQYAYIRVGGTAARPALAAVRDPVCSPAHWMLGPFPSLTSARAACLAFREAATALPADTQLDRALINRADVLLAPLETQMRELGTEGRYEEAAALRDRAGTLARGISRQQRADVLRTYTSFRFRWQGHELTVTGARLEVGNRARPVPGTDAPVPTNVADELHLLATFLERQAARIDLIDLTAAPCHERCGEGANPCTHGHGLALPLTPLPRFRATNSRTADSRTAGQRRSAVNQTT